MKIRILLILPVLSLLLTGCKKDNTYEPPGQDNTPADRTIPVVFHVLYEDATDAEQNPSEEIFKQRIEAMNKFFASTLFTNPTIPGVPSLDIGVSFTLATHRPDGTLLTEPGINRVKYAGAANMSADYFLHSSSLTPNNKPIFWNPNRYINIWLFGFRRAPGTDEDESDVAGIAFLPFCTTTHPLFKLVGSDGNKPGELYFTIQPRYMHGMAFDNRSFRPPVGVDLSNDLAIINYDEGLLALCHEMGHYLGLLHVFAETDGCADPDNASDDGCADTPRYNRAAYMVDVEQFLNGSTGGGMLPGYLLKRKSCMGDEFEAVNIMDYFFTWQTQFTPDQKKRIDHVMAYSPLIPRSSLKTKTLLDSFPRDISGQLPEPILMRCFKRGAICPEVTSHSHHQ